MLKIYYLLYKLKKSPVIWIVRTYNSEIDAGKEFKYYNNLLLEPYEKYMLIERKLNDTLNNKIYIEDELEYKQFKKFTISIYDAIISYI